MNNEFSHLESFMKRKDLDDKTLNSYIKLYQQTNCPKTYEMIVNGCMNYMIKMCRTFKKNYTSHSQQELFSCIYKGMEKAIEKYDETQGASFSTYALYWFRYYVNDYSLKSTSKVNISQATHSKMRVLSGLLEVNDNMSNEQLSEAMETSVKTIVRLKSIKECMNNYSISGDEFINSQMEMKLFEEAQIDYDPELLKDCLKELNERDTVIITERFGLIDGRPKTLGEIGEIVGLTAERVRQIITHSILPKLREIYREKIIL